MAKSSKTPKKSPAKSAKSKVGRAKRRLLDRLIRQSVAQEKADRSERHAGLKRDPRAGIDRTRRASRR